MELKGLEFNKGMKRIRMKKGAVPFHLLHTTCDGSLTFTGYHQLARSLRKKKIKSVEMITLNRQMKNQYHQ
jgi:hypothetical protein